MSSSEAGRAAKRQRTSDPTKEGNVYAALFDWLRKAGAVGLDQLRVAESDGGVGLFAKCAIACGGAIAEIPQQCVLSSAASWQSDAGRACRRAVTANPSLSDASNVSSNSLSSLVSKYKPVSRLNPIPIFKS